MIPALLLAACLALPVAAWAQTPLTIALDWTLNANHTGLIVA